MKKIIIIASLFIGVASYGQGFPSTDSLHRYDNRFITNSAINAFTDYRLNTLLHGMINWIDSARLGTGGSVGVDTVYAVNDSTLRYKKNGVTYTFTFKGVYDSRRKVDTLYRKPGQDSIFLRINGVERAVKDSTGAGSSNTNLGSFYRWAVPGTNQIKTDAAGLWVVIDSTSNTNALTHAVDSSGMATYFLRRKDSALYASVSRLNDTAAALRTAIGSGGGGSTDITITHNNTTAVVNSSTGADGTINYAKNTLAGVLSPRNSDIGHLPEIKNYMAAMGLQSSNNVTNYTATSVDSVYYKFSTTRMGSSGGEFGGWLTNNLTGDSIQVRAPFWVVIGDSQAEGHPGKHGRLDPNGVTGYNGLYPDSAGQLSYHLRFLTNMRWYNHGIGGQTTTQVLRRFYRDAIGKPGTYTNADSRGNQTLWYKPQGVVIIAGINDVATGVNPSIIMRNLEQMAAICQSEGVQCVILNLPGDEVITQTIARGIETINKWLASGVMDQYGATVVDYNTWWQDPAYKDNFHAGTYIVDDIHPSAVGYDSLANYIFRAAHLPVLKRAIFYNEIDPGGFTGYSRPTGITIGGAPLSTPTAYSLTNAIDSVTITAPVWDSTWIKTTTTTNVSGTTYSGHSSIYWYTENNIDTLRVTKRTLYNNGSQKSDVTTTKLTILPKSYASTEPVLQIPLADYTTNPFGFVAYADGGQLRIVVNGLTTDAAINNAILSIYGIISTNSNIIAEGTNSRLGRAQFITGDANSSTWGFGFGFDGTTFGTRIQTTHTGGKSTFLFNRYDQATASAASSTLGASSGMVTRFAHFTPYFGNAGNTDQRAYGIFVDMTVDQTNGTHTGTQETALRLKTTLTSTTNTLVRGILQDNGHNYFNTASGNFAIGITDTSTAPTAKLHVNGTVRLDGMLAGSSSQVLVKDADSVVRQRPIADLLSAGSFSSGNYTATITNGTNVAASSFVKAHYYRMGTHVIVYLEVTIDPTSTGSTDIGISLPFASNLAASGDLMGVGNCTGIATQSGVVGADGANDRASFGFVATDTNNQAFYITYSYEIL